MGRKRPEVIFGRWEDAERHVAAWLRTLGYKDAEVTAGGPDGGVDVVSDRWRLICQVKHWGKPVNLDPVTALSAVGTARASELLLFVSTSGYASGVAAAADRMGVACFEMRSSSEGLIAVNERARAVAGGPSRRSRRHADRQQARAAEVNAEPMQTRGAVSMPAAPGAIRAAGRTAHSLFLWSRRSGKPMVAAASRRSVRWFRAQPRPLRIGVAVSAAVAIVVIAGVSALSELGKRRSPAEDAAAITAGKVALCKDGKYSDNVDFSATCSGGDGIRRWLARYGRCVDGKVLALGKDASCSDHQGFDRLLPGFQPQQRPGDLALCRNGLYSDNTDLTATCSGNGGLVRWLAAKGRCTDGTEVAMAAADVCGGHGRLAGLVRAEPALPTTSSKQDSG